MRNHSVIGVFSIGVVGVFLLESPELPFRSYLLTFLFTQDQTRVTIVHIDRFLPFLNSNLLVISLALFLITQS